MKRTRTNPKDFDHAFPCQHCGYRIQPHELLRVDGEHVQCPKCGKESLYAPKKGATLRTS
jgi:DNA-directed RNA polymerase subunit RPC12/RpoP